MREPKLGESKTATLVKHGIELRDEIESACTCIMVRGEGGRERPMMKAEFFREGARLLAAAVRAGKFSPTKAKKRGNEAEIARVVRPGRRPETC